MVDRAKMVAQLLTVEMQSKIPWVSMRMMMTLRMFYKYGKVIVKINHFFPVSVLDNEWFGPDEDAICVPIVSTSPAESVELNLRCQPVHVSFTVASACFPLEVAQEEIEDEALARPEGPCHADNTDLKKSLFTQFHI
jgi:hypothetical protein